MYQIEFYPENTRDIYKTKNITFNEDGSITFTTDWNTYRMKGDYKIVYPKETK